MRWEISTCTLILQVSHFINTLSSINLQQHVLNPTHKYGHMLDLVITRSDDLFLESDHYVVSFTQNQNKPNYQKTNSSVCNFAKIDMAAFQDELTFEIDKAVTSYMYVNDVNVAINDFNNAITTVLDKYAPIETKTCTIRFKHRWYINYEIHEVRSLERTLKKHENEINRQSYLS